MTSLSAKTAALTAVIALGSLMSSSAHAAILRSSNGVPVLTHDGNCVITNWEGSEECEAAKAAAGIGIASSAEQVVREGAVYFDFNKSALTPEAKHTLDAIAAKLNPHWGKKDHKEMADKNGKHHHMMHHDHHMVEADTLTIVGYADRIGKADYNQKLAMRRAQAVRAYLITKGVKAKHIAVRSLGKTAPKADCSADLPRKKLISCLHEDRRVEIEITHK